MFITLLYNKNITYFFELNYTSFEELNLQLKQLYFQNDVK